MFAPAAWAFGFGEPQVASAIGQPLRLRIPLRLDPDAELSAQCVRLVGSSGSDAIPTMTTAMARISIERQGDARLLRIDSVYPVNEPVLRVAVEAGCAQHARREFVLLLDPPDMLPQLAVMSPSAAAPLVQTAAAARSPSAAPTAEAVASLAAGSPATGGEVTGAAAALALGAATITGHMGEPVSLEVPVTGTQAASLDTSCVRLAGSWTGEGPPVLSQARLAVVRTAVGTQIDLLTENAVTVPALRVVLEAGCATAVRREYAVVLDGKPAPAGPADAAPLAPVRQVDTAAATPAAAASGAAPLPGTSSGASAPAQPRLPRKSPAIAVAPEHPGVAPAQSPAAVASVAAVTAGKPDAAQRPKAPAADRLVLASPADQPDPAAERVAEMDKRIADLTREVELLRSEMAADRQRAAAAAEAPQRLGAGWIVAILALLGLGVSGLMNLQRKRTGMPWEKPAWEPAASPMPVAAAASAGPVVQPAAVPARAVMPAAPAPAAPTPAGTPAQPVPPPLPRTGPLAAFDEFTGTMSTLTPDPDGPHTRIEVTELHAGDPEFGKMHTVFLEPGNVDAPPPLPAGLVEAAQAAQSAMPNRASGPAAEPAPARPAVAAPAELPPPAPTVVAPEQRHGAFTFDEGPYTQTPTLLVLDLDLTTRALPPEEVEIAKFAEAAKKLKDTKAGDATGASGLGEARKGYTNGH